MFAKKIIFSFDHKWIVPLEHENVNELVLVILQGRVEEEKRFSNKGKKYNYFKRIE